MYQLCSDSTVTIDQYIILPIAVFKNLSNEFNCGSVCYIYTYASIWKGDIIYTWSIIMQTKIYSNMNIQIYILKLFTVELL